MISSIHGVTWRGVRDYGWFHDTFGFSSQPAVEAISDAGRDYWNATTGAPGKVAEAITGSEKVGNFITPPTWEELGKPGEAFANDFDEKAGVLPPSWRQYAAPVTSALLNFIPGVGPLVSAGFTTAYNAGNMQRNQKGMDWGKVGIDAAKNFGTAAVSMGAGKLLSNAKAADAARTSASANGMTMAQGYNSLGTPGSSLGRSALSSFDTASELGNIQAGITAADVARYGSSVAANAATNRSSVPSVQMNEAPAVTANPSAGASTPTQGAIGQAVDTGYRNTMSSLSPSGQARSQLIGIGQQAVANTLAPQQSTPLSGFDTSGDITGGQPADGYQFGDRLAAFREPGASGRISPDELENLTMRIGYNDYQQRQGALDRFVPAGQYEPEPNTPYSGQLGQIEQGTEKSYQDLLREVDNYNALYAIREANPQITDEQMQGYFDNPDTQPVINGVNYFQGLQPMSAFNTSMIR